MFDPENTISFTGWVAQTTRSESPYMDGIGFTVTVRYIGSLIHPLEKAVALIFAVRGIL
jgi:hypothetical protein